MALIDGKTQQEVTKEAIDQIMDAVNIMGSDKPIVDGIIESLRTNHRTLQQNFWRVMVEVMKQYSEFRSDLRNEASVNLCKFITESLEKDATEKDPNLTPKDICHLYKRGTLPNLVAYLGYEEDGIDGFLCLNCKTHIRICVNYIQPIEYCPFCGTKFEGGWIKDKQHTRKKWYYKQKNDGQKYWILQSKKLEYYKENCDPWGDDDFEDIWGSYAKTKKELLELRNEIIKEFKEKPAHKYGYKNELYIRFAYKHYQYNGANKGDTILRALPSKKIVVKGKGWA